MFPQIGRLNNAGVSGPPGLLNPVTVAEGGDRGRHSLQSCDNQSIPGVSRTIAAQPGHAHSILCWPLFPGARVALSLSMVETAGTFHDANHPIFLGQQDWLRHPGPAGAFPRDPGSPGSRVGGCEAGESPTQAWAAWDRGWVGGTASRLLAWL